MKKLLVKFGGLIATIALMVTAANVNSACVFYVHQPKLPTRAARLRKF